MKKIFFIILFFCSINAFAQVKQKIDSIYYLLDTIKVPANARMWDIHEEYPSLKIYSIRCHCLQYDKEPTFVYNIGNEKDYIISKKDLSIIKCVNLTTLILKSKQFTAIGFKEKYAIFRIEPSGKKYVVRRVRLLKPNKPREPSIDYENITAPDPTKQKKD